MSASAKRGAGRLQVVPGAEAPGTAGPMRVGQIWPAAPDPDAPLPTGYAYRTVGVGVADEDAAGEDGGVEWRRVCSPAYVAGWATDLASGAVTVRLTVEVAGEWRTCAVAPSALLDPRRVASLADAGIEMPGARAAGAYLAAGYHVVRERTRPAHGTHVAGIQRVDGDVPVAVLPGVGQPIGPTGAQLPAIGYTDTAGVEFVRAPHPDVRGTRDTARDVWDHLWKLGDPRVLAPILGWHVAALWAPEIRAAMGGRFPLLNLWASRGSGKTTLLEWAALAVGGGAQVLTARATRFALLRDLAASTTIPVLLDEYRRAELSDHQLGSLHDLLRRAYDGSSDQRGQHDQTVRTYHLQSPVVLAGESRIADPALADRSILIALQRTDLVGWPGGRRALEWLQRHPDECRQAAGWILQRRLDDAAATPQALTSALRAHRAELVGLTDRQGQGVALPERALDGLAVVVCAWNWLADIGLPVELVDWADQVRRAAELRRDQGPVDWLVQFLEAAASDGRHPVAMECCPIKDGDGGGRVLKVGLAAARGAFDIWCRDHGYPRLDPEPELVHHRSFRGKTNSRIFGRQTKCWLFDTGVLAADYGIDPEFWPRTASRE